MVSVENIVSALIKFDSVFDTVLGPMISPVATREGSTVYLDFEGDRCRDAITLLQELAIVSCTPDLGYRILPEYVAELQGLI